MADGSAQIVINARSIRVTYSLTSPARGAAMRPAAGRDEKMGSAESRSGLTNGRLIMRRTITKSEQDAIRAKVLSGYTGDADEPSLQLLATASRSHQRTTWQRCSSATT